MNPTFTNSRVSAVAFAPLPADTDTRVHVDLAGIEPAASILQEYRQPLYELARRARRLGPVDAGAMVLLTGCGRGVGTTTLALALAAAASDLSVLLIDGDLGNAGLSRLLDPTPSFGWEEAVRGACSFDQPLRCADSQRRVAFLPLRQPVTDPGELMARPALRVWLPQLRQDRGLIIVDAGSIFNTAAKWTPWADLSILAHDSRKKLPLAQAWDILEEGGSHVLGVVETFLATEKISRSAGSPAPR